MRNIIAGLHGRTINGYTLDRLLGVGGNGAVFLAQPPYASEERYAVKVLLTSWSDTTTTDIAFRARFLREAQTLQRLHHPNIVPILDTGDDGEYAYIVMPYLSGGTLAARIADSTSGLPLDLFAAVLNMLAAAIDYAHSQGVIHRDIKPANVLLDEHGNVLLTDFGIARIFEEDATKLTATGHILGTPLYMSPEQCGGKPVGTASDIYSLGMVAYELATGRVAYQKTSSVEYLMAHINEAPPPPRSLRPDLPVGIEKAILRALAKDPKKRWPTAQAFANTVLNIVGPLVEMPTIDSTENMATMWDSAAGIGDMFPQRKRQSEPRKKKMSSGIKSVRHVERPATPRNLFFLFGVMLVVVALIGSSILLSKFSHPGKAKSNNTTARIQGIPTATPFILPQYRDAQQPVRGYVYKGNPQYNGAPSGPCNPNDFIMWNDMFKINYFFPQCSSNGFDMISIDNGNFIQTPNNGYNNGYNNYLQSFRDVQSLTYAPYPKAALCPCTLSITITPSLANTFLPPQDYPGPFLSGTTSVLDISTPYVADLYKQTIPASAFSQTAPFQFQITITSSNYQVSMNGITVKSVPLQKSDVEHQQQYSITVTTTFPSVALGQQITTYGAVYIFSHFSYTGS